MTDITSTALVRTRQSLAETALTWDLRAPRVGVVINPNSRYNLRNPGRAAALRELFGDRALVRETKSIGDLELVVSELLERRAPLWVADGGDGSLHWLLRVARRVLNRPEHRALGRRLPPIVPAGTGTINVVANAIGLPRGTSFYRTLREIVASGRALPLRPVDLMDITLWRRAYPGGAEVEERACGFVATAGGVGQRFFGELDRSGTDRGPATVARLLARSAASWMLNRSPLAKTISPDLAEMEQRIFAPTAARVTVDGQTFPHQQLSGINIASVPVRFGPVMKLFGKAKQAGVLHALYGNPSTADLIGSLPRGVLGLPPKGEGIVDTTCRSMTVEAVGDELLSPVLDGDTYRDVTRIRFDLGEPLAIPQLG
jgi:hypothetical protein